MDAGTPAHMRYAVRRLRRKLPKATIILCCWIKDMDSVALEQLQDSVKADLVAHNLAEAVKLCIEATGFEINKDHVASKTEASSEATAA
jgi:hypothetical protein